MSYKYIADIAASGSLWRRITACAWQEKAADSPSDWATDNMWRIAVQPGWASAWASAAVAGTTDPGGDESVITDGMILAAVQALSSEGGVA